MKPCTYMKSAYTISGIRSWRSLSTADSQGKCKQLTWCTSNVRSTQFSYTTEKLNYGNVWVMVMWYNRKIEIKKMFFKQLTLHGSSRMLPLESNWVFTWFSSKLSFKLAKVDRSPSLKITCIAQTGLRQ